MRLERFVVTDFQRIFFRQISQEALLQIFPFLVNGSKPSSVSIPTLYNQGLSKCTFTRKAQSLRCPARIDVESIALPFIPAIAIFKSPSHHQEHGLCCFGSSL